MVKITHYLHMQLQDGQNDCYCWICHKEGEVICCETCPRVFHLKCIQLEASPTEDWVCPECVLIMTAENMDTRYEIAHQMYPMGLRIINSITYIQIRFFMIFYFQNQVSCNAITKCRSTLHIAEARLNSDAKRFKC